MLRAMIAGERDPDVLAELAKAKLRNKISRVAPRIAWTVS
jgi:hypothetical protein